MLLIWGMAHAETAIYKFETPEQEKLFYELSAELRCPQCQNNNIAESNAGLSDDMRAKVYELVLEGQSKKEIVQYMVDRYGNFITYDPPVTSTTLILWIAPIISLLIGLIYIVYRSRKAVTAEPAQEEQKDATPAKTKKDKKAQTTSKQSVPGFVVVTVGILFIGICTSGIFHLTTDWKQRDDEKKIIAMLPELKERYNSGNIDSVMQVQYLAIGLRSQLLKAPDNADDWRLLGEVYDDYMRRPDEAMRALENAYRYNPDDARIKGLYAQLLLRTSLASADREKAIELLNALIIQNPNDVNALYWLALHAQSEQQYMKSIALWERILNLLPPSTDKNRIREHLENDKQAYEQLQATR